MKRVIAHWTAGGHKATALDKKHYHFIFEGDGTEVKGKWPVKANKKGSIRKGRYAAHTYRCNTDSIGVSMACMRQAKELSGGKIKYGPSPMTEAQFDAMCVKIASLCKEYGIEPTRKTVLSHAEVQPTLKIKQRGKWDFTVLAFDPQFKGAIACGDEMRRRVSAYMKGAKPKPKGVPHRRPTPKPKVEAYPYVNMLRRGDKGPEVAKLQQSLMTLEFMFGPADGDFGANTLAGVRAFQHEYNLKIDGVAGPKTLAAIADALAASLAKSRADVTQARKEANKADEALEDIAAEGRVSKAKAVSVFGGGALTLAGVKETADDVGGIMGTLASYVPEWFIPAALVGGVGFFGFQWWDRNRKQNAAIKARVK